MNTLLHGKLDNGTLLKSSHDSCIFSYLFSQKGNDGLCNVSRICHAIFEVVLSDAFVLVISIVVIIEHAYEGTHVPCYGSSRVL